MAMDERRHGLLSVTSILCGSKDRTNLGGVILDGEASASTYQDKIEPIGPIGPIANGSLNVEYTIRYDLGGGLLPGSRPLSRQDAGESIGTLVR